MDERINWFLKDQNLSHYRNSFLHFDFTTFLNLNLETINELIPAEPDGIKLYTAIISFINGSDEIDTNNIVTENLTKHEVIDIDLVSMVNEYVLPDILEFSPTEKRKSTDLLQLQHPSLTITKIPRIERAESINVTIKQDPEDVEIIEMLSDTDTDTDNEDNNSSNDVQVVFDYIINDETEIFKKKKYNLKKFINSMDLQKIRDLDMHVLFAVYINKECFNYRERTLLSEIIIKAILLEDTTFLLQKLEFHKLAKLIVKTFPLESITSYFIKINHFNGPCSSDRGSLHTAFKKYQSILKTSGFPIAKDTIYKPRLYTKKKKPLTTVNTNKEQENKVSSNKTPSVMELERAFVESRRERLKKTLDSHLKQKFSTIKYVQLYKILQTKKGYEMIMKDAEYLYPNLKGFVSNFGEIANNIIEYAKRLNLADAYVSNLLAYAKQDISDEDLKFLAVLLLPYVLPRAEFKRREKSIITSHLASAVQFIRLFKNREEESQIYEEIFQEDPKFITGLSNVNIKLYGNFNQVFYIVVRVGVTDYKFKNPLQAIEVYIKMFLGMNLPYPIYAQHIFYFFESIAFDVQRSNTTNEIEMYESSLPLFKKFNKN